MSDQDTSADSLSIVIPLYNEIESIDALLERVTAAMRGSFYPWELILVDDGSSDGTPQRVSELIDQYGKHVHLLELHRNYGQTAAMQAGIDYSSGKYIVTMDGDLQNDPDDILRMLEELKERDLDLLQGWRKDRKDGLLLRKIPSMIANRLIANITGVSLHDYGCSLKVYRSSLIKRVRLYGEMHRFIPVWAAVFTRPSKIGETVVKHHAREQGTSKYGISRTFRVILDLIFVYFFLRFRSRPGHFFGMVGLASGTVSALILSYLAVDKFVFGADIGTRPLLLVGIVLLIASLQFITTGVLAELMTRTYYESTENSPYQLTGNLESKQVAWKTDGNRDKA
ncbi:glycosyltransferase [Solemya velum gill symbiont]|uniref:Glycosyltransferase n=1 Tax=Solemya velum gill symbiont TaxID=2340 RepID=A0A0B0H9S7_SOVGS|nr:glycosyltransferase family 2 protein [Solemya velum gill symbiont]KHF25382.1 glycosyltransferase [Solemya velum gill symbiont]OOZ15761.1 glycosyltransferase [Solemya velum gill symbiont]OOZ18433.1 glycosyltransferase [Solemya velum gill symbiont]OOZ20875.1 glycosyltransferase [Solemya velum gill symbiont]OOZ23714.1 glycosyltransferase [Solemya velum gill symbiont]